MGVTRKTKSVETLIGIFQEKQSAVSVVELIEQLASKMNKTTVYRILERLEEDGIVHSFVGSDGLRWYATCQDCSSTGHNDVHPHTQCSNCGKINCITEEIKLPEIAGFKIETAEILLLGRCSDCAR